MVHLDCLWLDEMLIPVDPHIGGWTSHAGFLFFGASGKASESCSDSCLFFCGH